MTDTWPVAVVGGRMLTDLVDRTADLGALDSRGHWAVLAPFEGDPVCARFATVRPRPARWPTPWPGLAPDAEWSTSLDRAAFEAGVSDIRRRIERGEVYQVNLTRTLSTPWPTGGDIMALGAALANRHPAPHSGSLRLADVAVASASPERYLRRRGTRVWSSPIKGTATSADALLDKDWAENVMIVDLVRNDLGRVGRFGSVTVPELCAVEHHPGLVHLVSTVQAELRPGVGWAELVEASFPPGSVTGAPKLAALEVIRALEPEARGPYCGALGWVDADRAVGELNVAIRTFWQAEGQLWFGTGGAITWDSDPEGEWAETELKAERLLAVAATADRGGPTGPASKVGSGPPAGTLGPRSPAPGERTP